MAETCNNEQILNSDGTPSSLSPMPTKRSDFVSIAISGCPTSYDWPLDITSRKGLKGRCVNSSRKVYTVISEVYVAQDRVSR